MMRGPKFKIGHDELGTCDTALGPHEKEPACENWKPLAAPAPKPDAYADFARELAKPDIATEIPERDAPKPEASAEAIFKLRNLKWEEKPLGSPFVFTEQQISLIEQEVGAEIEHWRSMHGKAQALRLQDQEEIARLTQERDAAVAAGGGATFSMFARINRERCESPSGFNHKLASWSTSDWFLAALGELGEAANVAKKLNRVRDGIPGNKESPDELRAKVQSELGDVFVYLDLLAQSLGFYIGDAAIDVFNAKSEQLSCPIRINKSSDAALELERVRAAIAEHAKGCCCNEQGPENCVRLAELQRREKELSAKNS